MDFMDTVDTTDGNGQQITVHFVHDVHRVHLDGCAVETETAGTVAEAGPRRAREFTVQ